MIPLVFLWITMVAPGANAGFNFQTSTIGGFNGPYHVITADFNNDTKPDLAVTNWPGNQLTLLLGDGAGHYPVVSTLATGLHPNFIAAGDFDNNGSTDLAITNGLSRDVTLLLNDGTGTSWTSNTLGTGGDADLLSVVAGNFTPSTDGDTDLLLTKDSGYVTDFYEFLRGDGTGAFTETASADTGELPIFAAAGDLDGDSNLDLAIASYYGNSLTILLGHGDGTFSEAVGSPIAVGTSPRAIALGHLNSDAHIDLAVTNFGDDTVSILLGHGDGTFSAAADVTSGNGVVEPALGDFDGDGTSDLAVTRYYANVVSIYRGNGDGTFDPAATDLPAGTGPHFMVAADLDQDGRPDLAVANYTGNDLTILLNRSGECAQAPSGVMAWWSGDGHPLDLLGTNHGTPMNGATFAAGRVGLAFSLDGVDDYVDAGTSDAFNFASGAGDFTIGAWVNPTALAPWASTLVTKATQSPFSGWSFYMYSDGRLGFGGVGVWELTSGAGAITAGSWVHLAVTKSGTTYSLYKNGVEVASGVRGSPLESSTAPLTVGTDFVGLNHNGDFVDLRFNGLVDELEIFDRALSAEEIAATHASGGAGHCRPCVPPPPGLASWWTGNGDAADQVGENDGTLQNGAAYAPGMVGQAFSLDGVDDQIEVSGAVADFGGSPFSVEFWMKPASAGYGSYLVGKSHPDGGQGWDIRLHDSRIHVVGVDGWPAQFNIQTDQVIVAGQWHHVAVTATATAVEVYVNGVFRGSSARQPISSTSNPFRMGFTTNFGGTAFGGLLDEVRLHTSALSAVDVAAIYAAGSSGTCLNDANAPPVLDFIGNMEGLREGESLSFTTFATDPDDDPLTYGASDLPTGASFDPDTRTFSWTPDYDQAGDYDVTFTVSDGELSDSETITMTVANVNRAPVLDTIGDRSVDEEATLSFTVSATDEDGDTLTYEATDLPIGATLDGGTGAFSWVPGYSDSGSHSVTVSVTDGTDTDSETITITVNNVNRAPVLDAIGDQAVDEGSLLSFTVSANDDDDDPLSYSASNLPSGASFNPDTRTFSWTPSYNQAGTYADVFFDVTDGEDDDSETITITINNVNRPPVLATIGDRSVSEGVTLSFSVSAGDADGDGLTYSASNLPTGASFDPDTQAFSWTPTLDQDGTYPGVLFSVTDGIDTDTETITITVRKAGATDFNADGKADLLFRQPSTGDLVAWYMNGVTKTGGAALSTKPGSTSWVPVGLGDFGAAPPVKDATALETAAPDGKPDILFRNQATGDLVVWFMDGVTKAGGAALSAKPGSTDWVPVGIADFGAASVDSDVSALAPAAPDGKPDILFRNQATGDLVVWFMDGVTKTGGAAVSAKPGSTSWVPVGAADFTADGKPDILFRNQATSDLVVWYLDGVTKTGGAALSSKPANTSWLPVALGDYSQDGKTDVVFQLPATGDVVVWYLDGVTKTGGAALSPSKASLPWQVVAPR